MQKNAEVELEIAADAGMVDTADDEIRSSVYEIGYHLLPSLSEEEVTSAVKDLIEFLKNNGATLVGDRHPAKIPLAYSISKRIAGKISHFDEAYFGWVAFEGPVSIVATAKERLDAGPVLRYLIIKTSKDAVQAALTGAVAAPVTGNIEKPKREAESGGEVSETALNEALQTIATEDAKTE
jgi:ribosomal protein S6